MPTKKSPRLCFDSLWSRRLLILSLLLLTTACEEQRSIFELTVELPAATDQVDRASLYAWPHRNPTQQNPDLPPNKGSRDWSIDRIISERPVVVLQDQESIHLFNYVGEGDSNDGRTLTVKVCFYKKDVHDLNDQPCSVNTVNDGWATWYEYEHAFIQGRYTRQKLTIAEIPEEEEPPSMLPVLFDKCSIIADCFDPGDFGGSNCIEETRTHECE